MFNEPFKDNTSILVLGLVLYLLKDYWLILCLIVAVMIAIEFVKWFDKINKIFSNNVWLLNTYMI